MYLDTKYTKYTKTYIMIKLPYHIAGVAE